MGPVVDAETGFQYLRARYYDPATGQFLTRDPIEAVTGTPYAYANNSPLNFTDPSGEIPLVAAVALAWGAVEVGLSAWDAVGTARTLLDECASGSSKIAAIGLFAAGIVGPGAGYGTAAKGGAKMVRFGQAGGSAVRGAYAIGPKVTAQINGRTRIFDGLNSVAVSEVKNVRYQAYTQQLKDSLAYAQKNGLRFDLYVRCGANPTILSGPLAAAVCNGDINLRFIP